MNWRNQLDHAIANDDESARYRKERERNRLKGGIERLLNTENNTVNRGSEERHSLLAFHLQVCGDALLSWVTMSEVGFSYLPADC